MHKKKKLILCIISTLVIAPYMTAGRVFHLFSPAMVQQMAQEEVTVDPTLVPSSSFVLKSECDNATLNLSLSKEEIAPYMELICKELNLEYNPMQDIFTLKGVTGKDLKTIDSFLTYVHSHRTDIATKFDCSKILLKNPTLIKTLFTVFYRLEPEKTKMFLHEYEKNLTQKYNFIKCILLSALLTSTVLVFVGFTSKHNEIAAISIFMNIVGAILFWLKRKDYRRCIQVIRDIEKKLNIPLTNETIALLENRKNFGAITLA